uniref:Uncharacterized protein ycf20 n=1 Tax=Balbiania investiens TaxID=111861 RepID=A0A4D6BLT3_9FLOR|nr:hypothetical protein [Balbiania investiens]QBX88695.1 hypothetical protein [Balbiania investiens]
MMLKTQLEIFVGILQKCIWDIFSETVEYLSFYILNILLGFFMATALSTIPSQTGDWGIIAAALMVTFYELISQFAYPKIVFSSQKLIKQINSIKVGILYGLFVDAFKLGS